MKGSRGLRFTSTAAMPDRLRELVEAQGINPDAPPAAKGAKPNKYGAKATVVDGIRFASKKEARYFEQLKLRKASGEVWYWLRQVPIHLPGGTRYVIDFLVFFHDPERDPEYVDVKGKETQVFRIKKREVEHHYPIKVTLA